MRRALTILPALAFLGAPLSACQRLDAGKSQIGEKWATAWNSHDAAQITPLYTENVLYEDVPLGAVNHGTDELRKFAGSFADAVPDYKLNLVKSAIDQNHGTIEWVLSGTDKGMFKTGKKFSVRGASVFDIEGGRISRNLDYYDVASIMRQVGALPAAPADSAK